MKPAATPRVSAIIPLYNNFRWLLEAARSVAQGGIDDWEAILVNDGSTTDPKLVIAELLSDPRYRYLEGPHRGIAGARNEGAGRAKGDWLAFLDQDDVSMPGRFLLQLKAVESSRAEDVPAVIYSDYERIDEQGQVIDRFVSGDVAPDGIFRAVLSDRIPVALGTALIRRDWLHRAGGFDPGLPGFDEGDLYLRIARLNGRFRYAPGVAHRWRNHPGNTMKQAEFENTREAYVKKVESLAKDDPRIGAAFPKFLARSLYASGLYCAEHGRWKEAASRCGQAWRKDPGLLDALWLAAKSKLLSWMTRTIK